MRKFSTDEMKSRGGIGWTSPYVIGCVSYVFGRRNSYKGETGFLREIHTLDSQNRKIRFMLPIGQEIPEQRLSIEKSLLGGEYAR
jgi:hypothetical protein